MGSQLQSRWIDLAIAELAGRQHGVVARWQLAELGITGRAVQRRLQSGRLHMLHRGVYAVGHSSVTREGRWMAAVLAGGPGAVLSHRAAAALWRMRSPWNGPVEITAPRHVRVRSGPRSYVRHLPQDEITIEDGIPVTTPPRTLFDLASVINTRQLERAIREADYFRLHDALSLADVVARYPGNRGVAIARAALERRNLGAGKTRSDSREAHATPHAFENDRERDRILSVHGWQVVRLTWRQLHGERAALAADLERLLAARTA